MIDNKIDSDKNAHYSVGYAPPYYYPTECGDKLAEGGILLQVAEHEEQCRIRLTVAEANHIIQLLQDNIKYYQESLKKV